MKFIIPFILAISFFLSSKGQEIRKEFNTVVIKNAPNYYKNYSKLREQYMVRKTSSEEIKGVNPFSELSSIPQFPKPNFSVYSIEAIIKPFDEADFGLTMLMIQIQNSDTVSYEISIKSHRIKADKLLISLNEEDIKISNQPFYIGYRILPKKSNLKYKFLKVSDKYSTLLITNKQNVIFHKQDFLKEYPFVINYQSDTQ